MDPLERQFAAAFAPLSTAQLDAQCPAHSGADLLQHAVTPVDYLPHKPLVPAEVKTTIWDVVFKSAATLSTATVGRWLDVVGIVILLYMVWRTCLYVKLRREGLVGPSMASVFMKFWSIYGFLECVSYVLDLYFVVFNGTWLVSMSKTIALLYLAWGRRLHNAVRIYDERLVPFYEEQSPEIERLFSEARTVRDKFDAAFQEYAKYLLKRIEVGGLSGALSDLSQEIEKAAAAQNATEQQSVDTSRRERPLPQQSDGFDCGREFFAVAQDRADAVAHASTRSIGGVIQLRAAEPPKAAYDDLRALRRTFSARRTQPEKSKPTPG